jgi:hypothetical protein
MDHHQAFEVTVISMNSFLFSSDNSLHRNQKCNRNRIATMQTTVRPLISWFVRVFCLFVCVFGITSANSSS